MRRFIIVSGILLILPVIDFALAAPVLVRENRRACVDVIHRPEDMITVLGKRVDDPLDPMFENYFESIWGKPKESSATPASLSPTPSELDYELTDIVQAPAPNSGPSTANPNHALVEPSSPSSAVSPVHHDEVEAGYYDYMHEPPSSLTSSEIGSDHGLMEAHMPQPNSNPRPSTGSRFNWKKWVKLKDPPPPRPASSQPWNPKPSTKSGLLGFANKLMGFLGKLNPLPRPQARPALSTPWDPNPSDPKPGRSNPGPWNQRLTTNLDSHPNLVMALRPLPPPLKFRPQKAEEEPLDLEATAYNAKGKATDFGEEFRLIGGSEDSE
ncbi:hypothetical protein BGY98DRAFT_704983 [Russula aff. rugulosa BPL654]|nr:hypothetical protein BGY98DRAFT_704983 [Russula aff. rugulosa BPL654]